MALRVGDKVEAQFKGKGKAYPATVKKDNGDGTYALEYDDGDKEDALESMHIKFVSGDRSFAESAMQLLCRTNGQVKVDVIEEECDERSEWRRKFREWWQKNRANPGKHDEERPAPPAYALAWKAKLESGEKDLTDACFDGLELKGRKFSDGYTLVRTSFYGSTLIDCVFLGMECVPSRPLPGRAKDTHATRATG